MTDVMLVEDELVSEDCPLHADLELGDLTALSTYDRRWLENIACPELHLCYDAARRAQLKIRDLDLDDRQREQWGRELRLGVMAANKVRAAMRRMLAREPEPAYDGPRINLWDR